MIIKKSKGLIGWKAKYEGKQRTNMECYVR